MCKEMYIAAHEQLIEEALERYPNMTYDHAYAMTADAAGGRMLDKYADMCDHAADVAKGK